MSLLGRDYWKKEGMRRSSEVWTGHHSGFTSFLEWVILLGVVVFAIFNVEHGSDVFKTLVSLVQR